MKLYMITNDITETDGNGENVRVEFKYGKSLFRTRAAADKAVVEEVSRRHSYSKRNNEGRFKVSKRMQHTKRSGNSPLLYAMVKLEGDNFKISSKYKVVEMTLEEGL